jgi:uncharacterized membrane protein YhaH (DUF805 family)
MGETLREAATSIVRTVGRTFIFTGRSRRLEIGYYWIAWMLVAGAGSLAVQSKLDWASAVLAREAIHLVAATPFFALFARRLHDQGRSAWWTLALPPLLAANTYDHLRVNFHAFDPAWPGLAMWNLVLLILALGSFVAMLLPGDVGTNRYGPDPRLDERETDTASGTASP